ncbi:DUF6407 family protein [Halalkalibacter akibai]|uniref:Uncharacterized protein ybcH n=1 Tax=Halalkalibacter akibai (strain ATCC 43226 / DSM 21942 / CIP 109018 / JCM 9157 / 1139) TaxID=1236973 RepID=W4QTV2_HALA3|nr:DUF6407 family protein [Halalkalibacter akibai]GAE35496.1 uncharacterized protein ybcH [Halalkalibacter akibai JCM 9157]
MQSRKSFTEFVKETKQSLKEFDPNNDQHIKDIVRKAIQYYDLQSTEKVEDPEKSVETLYVASMIEENILSKITELASENSELDSIEALYNGFIIRKH